jgi:hypothetical protein
MGAVQIENDAIQTLKSQQLYTQSTHNLLSSITDEGDKAEAAIEAENEGEFDPFDPKLREK